MILTREIPAPYNARSEVISIRQLWEKSCEEKKQLIKNIFGLSEKILEKFQGKTSILFTQPFSEDKLIDEKEKIDFYRPVFTEEGSCLVVKKYPRDTTDYQALFPFLFVFEDPIPFELLSLCGVRFQRAYTVSSTAAFNFDYPIEIIPIHTGRDILGETFFIETIAKERIKKSSF